MPMSPRLLRPRANNLDPDAAVYLNAVAAADGEQLESAVRKAINDFVVGCKRDGIWNAIKASCLLVGARTLSGALTPLVGAAPTNNNFVSGDYNRKTGLLADGSTKYIDSGRNNNADPQNSKHLACYVSAASTASSGARTYIGSALAQAPSSWLHGAANTNLLSVRANASSSVFDLSGTASITGFIGVNRASDSANVTYRYSGTTNSAAQTSGAPGSSPILVFYGVTLTSYSDARIAFYSIGESLTLASLDSRISTLYTAIGAAIQ